MKPLANNAGNKVYLTPRLMYSNKRGVIFVRDRT